MSQVTEIYQYYGFLPTTQEIYCSAATWEKLQGYVASEPVLQASFLEDLFSDKDKAWIDWKGIPIRMSSAIADNQILVTFPDGKMKIYELVEPDETV